MPLVYEFAMGVVFSSVYTVWYDLAGYRTDNSGAGRPRLRLGYGRGTFFKDSSLIKFFFF